eukprot:TRINITY_DN2818_c0_g2_i5.p4 TRINITY_DN2818_c0_g2~~TRINITY_DN2818_c0_g2_i5.p4  ORF type:complete len:207 (-),score=58.15 TRINITY_DN2818_c0_g2_i5:1470-2090(-)
MLPHLLTTTAEEAAARAASFFGASSDASRELASTVGVHGLLALLPQDFWAFGQVGVDVELRHAPDFRIRYIYWVSFKGELSCVCFKRDGSSSYQEVMWVQGVPTLAEWELDELYQNNSYPSNPALLGGYNVLDWLIIEKPGPFWVPELQLEQTAEVSEVVSMFFTPVYNTTTGAALGVMGADIVVDNIVAFLHTLDISAHARRTPW